MKRRHILKTVCFFLAASGLLLATACGNQTEDTDTEDMDTEAVTASDDTAADASTDTAAEKPSTTEERETGTEDGTEAETSKTGTTAPASSGKSTTATQTGTGSSPSPAPSGGGSTPSASSPSPSTPPASSGSSTTAAPAAAAPTEHTHSWVASTQTVYHEEEGHYEQVEIAPAFTQPNWVTHTICFGCGFDYTANHVTPPHTCPDGSIWNYGGKTVQDGYITTPAVYENQWVVDKEGWTETVTTYTCSGCGATK